MLSGEDAKYTHRHTQTHTHTHNIYTDTGTRCGWIGVEPRAKVWQVFYSQIMSQLNFR